MERRGFTISGNEAPAVRDILKKYDVERAARHLSSELLDYSELQRLQSKLHDGRYYYIGSPHMTPEVSLAAEIEELQLLSGSVEFFWLDSDIAGWAQRGRNGFVLGSDEWKERQPASIVDKYAMVWREMMLADHDNAVAAWRWLAEKQKTEEKGAQESEMKKELQTTLDVETRQPWEAMNYLDAMEYMHPEHFLKMNRWPKDLVLQSSKVVHELDAGDASQPVIRIGKELEFQALELRTEEILNVRKVTVRKLPSQTKIVPSENTDRQEAMGESSEARKLTNQTPEVLIARFEFLFPNIKPWKWSGGSGYRMTTRELDTYSLCFIWSTISFCHNYTYQKANLHLEYRMRFLN